ncbi:MAG: hypothetical protein HOL51_16690 [Gemmatimonadetes bacterium]|jgi:hypothetical protein|nr:hypothetical protein [Gemmatimonadota bacterium]MBT5327748.1 hypothetical protein [Gemmatimonadota bacterium]MBT5453095.1 hypothetical protein [Gemmatimonadota bacterium]MBT5802072.1 hypothetical protein [Gemmatimonadota bacterium]MBT6622484.1 hypothetical protein [Gemmatimonadota bacterium]
MGTTKKASVIVRRSLGWASSFMAIAATTLLGKVEDVQAAPDIRVDGAEPETQVVDQAMGYVTIGDYDRDGGWTPSGGNQ